MEEEAQNAPYATGTDTIESHHLENEVRLAFTVELRLNELCWVYEVSNRQENYKLDIVIRAKWHQ